MQLSALVTLAIMLVSTGLVSALPAEDQVSNDLMKRAGSGTEKDPYVLDIDCTGVEEVCEARCLAMLCFEVPNPYIYESNKKAKKKRRSESGYSLAFKGSDAQRAKRGTSIPPNHPTWKSAEETVRASAKQGGFGTPLVPVDAKHNSKEGSNYKGQLEKNKVKSGSWVKDHFTGLSNNAKYCNAYQSSKPNKDATCKSSNADDPINFIYWKTDEKKGNTIQFHKLQYGKDTWANRPTH